MLLEWVCLRWDGTHCLRWFPATWLVVWAVCTLSFSVHTVNLGITQSSTLHSLSLLAWFLCGFRGSESIVAWVLCCLLSMQTSVTQLSFCLQQLLLFLLLFKFFNSLLIVYYQWFNYPIPLNKGIHQSCRWSNQLSSWTMCQYQVSGSVVSISWRLKRFAFLPSGVNHSLSLCQEQCCWW